MEMNGSGPGGQKSQGTSSTGRNDSLVSEVIRGWTQAAISETIEARRVSKKGQLDHTIENDPTKAHLCIFYVGGGDVPVLFDELPLADITSGTYFQLHVNPGKHSLTSEHKEALNMEYSADQTYFIEITTSFWNTNGKPEIVSTERFRQKAKGLKILPDRKFRIRT